MRYILILFILAGIFSCKTENKKQFNFKHHSKLTKADA
jgi:hypothetical protein